MVDGRRTAVLATSALVLLLAAREMFSTASIIAFLAGAALLFALPLPYLLHAARAKSGDRSTRRVGRWGLAAASAWVALLSALAVLVGLRGEFHRPHSHRDEAVLFHPELGHAPMNEPPGTIGQRAVRIAPERRHVVLMGDSVMYGWHVEDNEVASAYLSDGVRDFQVLNASVSGYSIAQYLLYLERHLPDTNPAVVVVGLFAGNDYESTGRANWAGHSTPLFVLTDPAPPAAQGRGGTSANVHATRVRDLRAKEPADPTGGEAAAGGLALWRRSVPRLNCIDFLAGSLLLKPIWTASLDVGERLIDVVCNAKRLEEPEHREVVSRLLRALADLAESRSARLVYVLLPDRNDFRHGTWYTEEKSRYSDLASLLKDGGYQVLWFYDVIEASGLDVDSLYLPGDSAHLSPEGHRLLAEALAAKLSACCTVR